MVPRADFTAQPLRGLARLSKDAPQVRQLLSLAVIAVQAFSREMHAIGFRCTRRRRTTRALVSSPPTLQLFSPRSISRTRSVSNQLPSLRSREPARPWFCRWTIAIGMRDRPLTAPSAPPRERCSRR